MNIFSAVSDGLSTLIRTHEDLTNSFLIFNKKTDTYELSQDSISFKFKTHPNYINLKVQADNYPDFDITLTHIMLNHYTLSLDKDTICRRIGAKTLEQSLRISPTGVFFKVPFSNILQQLQHPIINKDAMNSSL